MGTVWGEGVWGEAVWADGVWGDLAEVTQNTATGNSRPSISFSIGL